MLCTPIPLVCTGAHTRRARVRVRACVCVRDGADVQAGPPLPVCALPMHASMRLLHAPNTSGGSRTWQSPRCPCICPCMQARACNLAPATRAWWPPCASEPVETSRRPCQTTSMPLGGGRNGRVAPRAAELSWLKTCGGPQYWAARPACMVYHLPPQHPRYKAQEKRSQMRHQWALYTPEEGNGCHAKLPDTIALRGPPPPSHATDLIFSGARKYSGSNVGVGARNGGVCALEFLPTALLLCLTRQRSPQPPLLALPRPPMHAS